ncbi:hypothetical protein ACFFJN_06585 [Erwinia mallotivora]|uniref:hypothetical protein n=1 Tax=Erwinia mallotivora TaxID=69222 RepID=UPI0035E7FE6F
MLLVNQRALEKSVVDLKNEIHKLNEKSEKIRGEIKSENAVLDCLRIKKGNLAILQTVERKSYRNRDWR